jgi:uncharacterized protein (DUF697 family)
MLAGVNLIRVLRDVNLTEINRESERRFRLLVIGERDVAEALARTLSDDEDGDTHPWVVVESTDAPTSDEAFDLAVAVTERAEVPAGVRERLRALERARVKVVVAVTGDALQDDQASVARRYEAQRVAVPSLGLQDVRSALAPCIVEHADAGMRLSLARSLPPLRDAYARALVDEVARANAVYVASTGVAKLVPVLNVPLNVADVVVLTKNQLMMAYRIARAYGKEGRAQDLMGEVVGVIGGGMFFRQIAREMIGLVPGWGIVPNVAISFAGTWVIGKTVTVWARTGRRLDQAEIRRLYGEALSRGRQLAGRIVRDDGGEDGASGSRRGLLKPLWRRLKAGREARSDDGANASGRELPPPASTPSSTPSSTPAALPSGARTAEDTTHGGTEDGKDQASGESASSERA